MIIKEREEMSLDKYGYHRPNYAEILQGKLQMAKTLFGEDIDTSEQTPLGKFIRIGAKDLERAYEDIEAVYYARFPNTAVGQSLDRLCMFAGIVRNPATFAQHSVIISGTAGTQVSEIVLSGENRDITFHNTAMFTIPENGSIDIVVECDISGTDGNVSNINTIINPVAGITDAEYGEQVLYAVDRESDYDLRKRFSVAVNGMGSSNVNGIRSAVLKVPTVKSVSIIENKEDKEVGGRPPHSFECYVYGGELYKQRIGEAIFSKAPVGIKTCSTSVPPEEAVVVYDESGAAHNVYFSYTRNIKVNIAVSYKKDARAGSDIEAKMSEQIDGYMNSYGVGDDVILSAIYGYIYKVQGISDVVAVSFSASGKTPTAGGNIIIDSNEVAQLGTISYTEVS